MAVLRVLSVNSSLPHKRSKCRKILVIELEMGREVWPQCEERQFGIHRENTHSPGGTESILWEERQTVKGCDTVSLSSDSGANLLGFRFQLCHLG